ncbi:hypothetical protein DSOUD_0530 [Desulfuromonas soudanensis]|uniref:Uncharacterized protein n=1 Tax=Desulfuromonas soudanensis TaxID=1603606 RepID=A0A0M3QEZ0_9BACT|nr:hypothetical protein [Desulfuromonas soudanensis]ALC15319.1 hypothetical protein DSOUD_0530 [Desulfuromonas soudanensis]
MKYNAFKSIVNSIKQPVELLTPSVSFSVKGKRVVPYIEPNFSKVEFSKEKPSILLVSAVGASGKTTTACALSFDTQLPVLDLAKHKPVGDNTLTGILTSAYPIEKVGAVLEGLRAGTHGIIIDGIDEARSKTTEQGFEAFLDDLIERSKGSASTAIVVFGRSQVLLTTWCYLVDKDADVGMVQIDPFDLDQAKSYIDSCAIEGDTGQQENYEQARDGVLTRLSAAFQPAAAMVENTFLSFIGYPPVLDAIGTLLRTERNYHSIQQALSDGTGGQLEINLLIRISDYLLDREHKEKALPNFINQIVTDAGASYGEALRQSLFSNEEQCARILSRALSRPFPLRVIEDNALNERYEQAVATWCPEHPFLDDTRVRNVVFAAVAITRCALSSIPEYRTLAHEYTSAIRPTYHLLYIMAELGKAREISVQCFNMLIQSCSEFLDLNVEISINIDGESWEDQDQENDKTAELTIEIKFPEKEQERTFIFKGIVDNETISLGPYLINTRVTLPCHIDLSSTPAVEAIGDCSIFAPVVRFDTPDLIIRSVPKRTQDATKGNAGLFINARKAQGHAGAVSLGAGDIEIQCVEHSLVHPLAKYARKVVPELADPTLREKYRRLRRIFSEFASHSKGGLAKYRDKIEHQRVLRNSIGKGVLDALVKEGVLRSDSKFYYVDPVQFDAKLGISWHQLRQYESSSRLETFLKGVS